MRSAPATSAGSQSDTSPCNCARTPRQPEQSQLRAGKRTESEERGQRIDRVELAEVIGRFPQSRHRPSPTCVGAMSPAIAARYSAPDTCWTSVCGVYNSESLTPPRRRQQSGGNGHRDGDGDGDGDGAGRWRDQRAAEGAVELSREAVPVATPHYIRHRSARDLCGWKRTPAAGREQAAPRRWSRRRSVSAVAGKSEPSPGDGDRAAPGGVIPVSSGRYRRRGGATRAAHAPTRVTPPPPPPPPPTTTRTKMTVVPQFCVGETQQTRQKPASGDRFKRPDRGTSRKTAVAPATI